MNQLTLAKMISAGQSLNDEQKQSLYELLCKGARQKSRDRLHSVIWYQPLSSWPCYGIYDRVHLEGNTFRYCAGQHYPTEVTYVRNLIIGRA